ncbi:MAG: ABC transporter permease subunit [Gammaproteobacteria bacterium]|jgi:ABC-type methionine transport system permease subunit
MLQILIDATYDTLRIVFIATVFTVLIGGPLGIFLEASQNEHILEKKYLWLHKSLCYTINFFSNIPVFLILIIMMPIINKILHNHFSIELAAVIALIFIGIFSFANDVFKTLNSLPKELSDTAKFLGAEAMQVLTKFLLPEAMQNLIKDITKLVINFIGLSIIASALGISGLGKLALEKGGYNDLETLELSYVVWAILLSTSSIYIVKSLSNYIISSIAVKIKDKDSE